MLVLWCEIAMLNMPFLQNTVSVEFVSQHDTGFRLLCVAAFNASISPPADQHPKTDDDVVETGKSSPSKCLSVENTTDG